MANLNEPQPSAQPPRPERLQELSRDLQQHLDEIVNARADRYPTLKKEFDAAWKELKNATGEPH